MIDKAALLACRLGEGKHEIEGVGTVRIRGLSHGEAVELQTLGGDVSAISRRMIAYALVEPTLTEDEVGVWQANSPLQEIEELSAAIAELSGMGPGAAKSGVSGVRG